MTIRLLKGRQSAAVLTWHYHLVVALATSVPLLLGTPQRPTYPKPHEWLLLTGVMVAQLFGQLLLNR